MKDIMKSERVLLKLYDLTTNIDVDLFQGHPVAVDESTGFANMAGPVTALLKKYANKQICLLSLRHYLQEMVAKKAVRVTRIGFRSATNPRRDFLEIALEPYEMKNRNGGLTKQEWKDIRGLLDEKHKMDERGAYCWGKINDLASTLPYNMWMAHKPADKALCDLVGWDTVGMFFCPDYTR
jgi:hypothetical protein